MGEEFEGLIADDKRSPTSLDTYRRSLKNHIRPALGELRIGEATPPRIDTALTKIKTTAGASTAKTCRAIISGAMKLAVRYGAITVNPVREVDTIEAPPKDPPRALTGEEVTLLRAEASLPTDAPSRPISPSLLVGLSSHAAAEPVPAASAPAPVAAAAAHPPGANALLSSTKPMPPLRKLPRGSSAKDLQRALNAYAAQSGQTYQVDAGAVDPATASRPEFAAASDPDVPGLFTYLTQWMGVEDWARMPCGSGDKTTALVASTTTTSGAPGQPWSSPSSRPSTGR